MDMDPELAREWITAANRLQSTMEKFPQRRATDGQPQAAAAVSAQAGNVSVKLDDSRMSRLMLLSVFSAVMCAMLTLIMLLALLGGGMLFLNMKDHLDAIYMMAPQLAKPIGDKTP